MKKMIFILCAVLALSSVSAVSADAKGHNNHNTGPRKEQPRRDKHPGNRPGQPNPGHRPGHPGPGFRPGPAPRPHHDFRFRPTPPRRTPVYVNSRPSIGFSVNLGGLNLWFSNGVYYQNIGPSRYELVTPPVGLVVPQLYNPWSFFSNGLLYYVENNVVYLPYGPGFRVVGYM